jgi:hypothetical protein
MIVAYPRLNTDNKFTYSFMDVLEIIDHYQITVTYDNDNDNNNNDDNNSEL